MVGDDQVRGRFLRQTQCLKTIFRVDNVPLVLEIPKHALHAPADVRLVINEHDSRFHAASTVLAIMLSESGMCIVIFVPTPSSDSISILPPLSSIIPRAIDSPIPVPTPTSLVVKPNSNM